MKYPLFIILLFIPAFLRADLYVVQRGDTLWGLASKYRLSASLIKKVNQLPYDELMAGQKIFLPKDVITHSVRSGETVESIAKDYNISVAYVITLNNLEDDMLAEGQKIKVPQTFAAENSKQAAAPIKSANVGRKTHTVVRGETLSGIALRYKVSLSSLKEWNDKKSSDIKIGEALLVQAPNIKTTPPETREIQSSSAPRMITNTKTYTVARGDTLGGIALRYKVPQKSLMGWNNKTRTTVYRGEKLKILTITRASEPAQEPQKTLIHTVRKGENLRIIADKYNISLSDIRGWNDKRNDTIYPDERLKIYSEAPANKKRTLIYTVRKGDTLDGIAFRYDMNRSTLMTINNKKVTSLYVGEKLRVPVSEKITANNSSVPVAKTQPEAPQGVKSTRFSGIPLPVSQSELKTVSPSGRGVDIYLKTQASLKAPATAVVEYAGYINALQNVVILKIEDNRTLIYAGLGSISVQNGQKVDKGEVLGIAGYSTIEESPKIYMELRDKEQIANAFYAYKDLEKYAKK